MTIKERIYSDVKEAMRAKDKEKLGTLRLITAAIKQIEVDERTDVDDTHLLGILTKMANQRKESINQFEKANRPELVNQEQNELAIINSYLPTPLSETEINDLMQQAFNETKAEKLSDMGKIMNYLKPLLQGRADIAKVSSLVKEKLTR